MRRGKRSRRRALAAAVALAVAGAACTGDDGDDVGAGATPTAPSPRVPTEPGRGCGPAATTDPSDLGAARVVARCGRGAPAPEPLSRPARLVVAVAERTEAFAPILLAQRLGEFEEENLDVTILDAAEADAYALLDSGEVDAVAGDIDGAFFDSAHAGSGVKVVLGGYLSPAASGIDVPQAGLWYRSDALEEPERWDDLEGLAVAIEHGIADAAVYPVGDLFDQGGLSLNDVDLVEVGGDAAAERLVDGKVVAAWLDEPHWEGATTDDGLALAATLPVSEALTGVVSSPRLLGDDRPVGVAFARAVIRTINTHLSGDYKENDDIVDALAAVTGDDPADLASRPGLIFDWEIRRSTTDRLQEGLIQLGGVAYERRIPEARLVDRSLAAAALGE